jgi:hypothetical protein
MMAGAKVQIQNELCEAKCNIGCFWSEVARLNRSPTPTLIFALDIEIEIATYVVLEGRSTLAGTVPVDLAPPFVLVSAMFALAV